MGKESWYWMFEEESRHKYVVLANEQVNLRSLVELPGSGKILFEIWVHKFEASSIACKTS